MNTSAGSEGSSAGSEVDVLYEDNHLLAVNKAPGLLTQDSGRDEDSLEAQARRYVKRTRSKPGAVFLHVVHRLDRVASGVVLCATTSKALERLNGQVRRRSVRKIYHALVEGSPGQDAGTLEHWLAHASHHARICSADDEGARQARLQYRVLERRDNTALLEIELETGRYHQIRAQLAAIGCPIVGDTRYGASPSASRVAGGGDVIALHHRELRIEHPVGGEALAIEAPYPNGWPER